MPDSMELIRDIINVADAAHNASMRSADQARHATYEAALRASGIDMDADFSGSPDLALMHFREIDAFDMSNLTTHAMLVERIEKESERDSSSRVPVLAVMNFGPVDLSTPPHHERAAITSLAMVSADPLKMKSTRQQIPDVVVNTVTGATTTVEERVLSIEANATNLPIAIGDKAEDEFGFEDVVISDILPIHITQRALDPKALLTHPRDEEGFRVGIAGRALESDATSVVGWQDIRHYFFRLASAYAHQGYAIDDEWIAPGSSPTYQARSLTSLTEPLELTSSEKTKITEIEAMLGKYAAQAASA